MTGASFPRQPGHRANRPASVSRKLTPFHVLERVQAIRDAAHDPGRAHGLERKLWEDALRAIANGDAAGNAAVALEALTSLNVPFPRYQS